MEFISARTLLIAVFLFMGSIIGSTPVFSTPLPVVGDTATLHMTTTSNQKAEDVEFKQIVTSVNAKKGFAKIQSTYVKNGKVLVSHTSKEHYNDPHIQESLLNCEKTMKGKLEPLTVPLGTFQVCHVHTEKNGTTQDSFLSNQIPFGVVKLLSSSPDIKVEATLMSFDKKI